MQQNVLLFEDKLGISSGYESIWTNLLMNSGLVGKDIVRRNSFRSLGTKVQLLVKHGNRKAPGFNPDPQARHQIRQWVMSQVQNVAPAAIICMDPAILFIFNPDWDQATLDNLRGGVYKLLGIPTVVTLPITAWHTQKKEKDIARMNEGFIEEEEWEEEHGGDETDSELNQLWLEPLVVPYGKFVLRSDLEKLARILRRQKSELSTIQNNSKF